MKLDIPKLLQMLGILQPEKIMYIGGSDILPQPLKPAQEQELLKALSEGSESAKQTLIERNKENVELGKPEKKADLEK